MCNEDKRIMLGLQRMAAKLCITLLSRLQLITSMHGKLFFFLTRAMHGKLWKMQHYRSWLNQKSRKNGWSIPHQRRPHHTYLIIYNSEVWTSTRVLKPAVGTSVEHIEKRWTNFTWNLLSRPCFALPPAESPSTMKISAFWLKISKCQSQEVWQGA